MEFESRGPPMSHGPIRLIREIFFLKLMRVFSARCTRKSAQIIRITFYRKGLDILKTLEMIVMPLNQKKKQKLIVLLDVYRPADT